MDIPCLVRQIGTHHTETAKKIAKQYKKANDGDLFLFYSIYTPDNYYYIKKKGSEYSLIHSKTYISPDYDLRCNSCLTK